MNKYDSNQYVEIFYKLPPEIKDVVAASSTTEHLWKIGQKRNLHIDKIGVMTDISFDVMMGIVSSKNFVPELQKELGISALDASVLARDIDENVFKPIKSTMIALYGDKAPNKPSSSLVQLTESDEDHHDLDRDLLLKEIESPVIAKPRVMTSTVIEMTPTSKEKTASPLEGSTAKQGGMSKSTAIEEYHQEINTGTVLPEIKPTETKPIPASFDSLHKLADMKLSQSFVMPKNTGGYASTITSTIPPTPVMPVSTPAIIPKAAGDKPLNAVSLEAPKQYSSDPYREPLN